MANGIPPVIVIQGIKKEVKIKDHGMEARPVVLTQRHNHLLFPIGRSLNQSPFFKHSFKGLHNSREPRKGNPISRSGENLLLRRFLFFLFSSLDLSTKIQTVLRSAWLLHCRDSHYWVFQ